MMRLIKIVPGTSEVYFGKMALHKQQHIPQLVPTQQHCNFAATEDQQAHRSRDSPENARPVMQINS